MSKQLSPSWIRAIWRQAIAATTLLLVACSPSGLPPPETVSTPTAPSISTASPEIAHAPTGTAIAERFRTPTRENATAVAPTPRPTLDTQQSGDAVLVGAGDIASCDSDDDEKTARLLDGIEGTVFTLGDNAYDNGTSGEYKKCYDPTWGRHKERTRPAVGNHEYRTDDAKAYFDYFGAAAGEPGQGWYSYGLGSWHIVVLNSNCKYVGGCDRGSPQERWLRTDLASHPSQCTLAYWHHPRFSAGKYEDDEMMLPAWQALYDAGAEVVLSGHDHNYQRYAPQTPDGRADPARGIRQFVVGTGGKSHYEIEKPKGRLEVYDDNAPGVLKLTLRADSYEWEFISVEGASFNDSDSDVCH
jgi:hypothetical protein